MPPVSVWTIASFYRFTRLAAPAAWRARVLEHAREHRLRGSLLVAAEGLNASIAGVADDVAAFLAWLQSEPGMAALDVRLTTSPTPPFRRLKVKLKSEIVSLGRPDLDPASATAHHLDPVAWHTFIQRPDVLVVDTRNSYEHALGSFAGARDAGLDHFREFPARIAAFRADVADRALALFCTGGIRCEKAGAWLRAQGVAEVYQLAGGILRYLVEVPREVSLWRGECFVFDDRVALDAALAQGASELCHACRRPVTATARASPHYVADRPCPHCHRAITPAQQRRLAARRHQVALATRRGESHLAPRE